MKEPVCQRCSSKRILYASGKTTDCFNAQVGQGPLYFGYPPDGLNITSDNDGIDIVVCLDCGQHQGVYPLPRCVAVEGVAP